MKQFKDEYISFDRNGMKVEVNYSEDSKPMKFIKFTIKGESVVIPNADLYSMMFLFGTPEQQSDLLPVRETKVRIVPHLLKIKAKKDIKKGEIIQVIHETMTSSVVYDKIKLEKGSDSKIERDINKIGAVEKPKEVDGEVVSI